MIPTSQLSPSPMEPFGPPPRSWKILSSGAMVWPCAYRKMRPRQTSRPPSVTMNDGTPPYATRNPWMPPMKAPRARPTRSAMIQMYGWSKPRPRVFGIHSAWTMAIV